MQATKPGTIGNALRAKAWLPGRDVAPRSGSAHWCRAFASSQSAGRTGPPSRVSQRDPAEQCIDLPSTIIVQRPPGSTARTAPLDCAQSLDLILHQMRLQDVEKILRFPQPRAEAA